MGHEPGEITRRALLAGAAAGAVVAIAGDGVATAASRRPSVPPSAARHQPGIATPQQAHAVFAAFDATAGDAAALAALLRTWSDRARELTRAAAPAERLTITIGLGPSLFDHRYGLGPSRPAALAALPAFSTDRLEPRWSGGDLIVQACAERRAVAAGAIDALARASASIATRRWTQRGFVAPSPHAAPRNLLGFREGTANPRAGSEAFRAAVWVDSPEGDWMDGGTYLVLRRVRLALPAWRKQSPAAQRRAIGRDRDGKPLYSIPLDAHAWRAGEAPVAAPMFRRAYNYDDGLLFCAFMRDPARQFTPVQRRLAASDRLNAFATHVGSAVFAIPPAAAVGGWMAQSLFETAPAS